MTSVLNRFEGSESEGNVLESFASIINVSSLGNYPSISSHAFPYSRRTTRHHMWIPLPCSRCRRKFIAPTKDGPPLKNPPNTSHEVTSDIDGRTSTSPPPNKIQSISIVCASTSDAENSAWAPMDVVLRTGTEERIIKVVDSSEGW